LKSISAANVCGPIAWPASTKVGSSLPSRTSGGLATLRLNRGARSCRRIFNVYNTTTFAPFGTRL
jgi:hypothetical protein